MSPRPHFLVLTFPFQGHIAPALRLARRLLAAAPDALVTFSTTEHAHRRMFPSTKSTDEDNNDDDGDGRLEFVPFSDGTNAGYVHGGGGDAQAFNAYMSSFHACGARSLGAILDALAARGRPVTRVAYTLLLPWAADVARARGVPSALYWIQPVAVFAIYHHYFRGGGCAAGVVDAHRGDPSFVVELPGLPPHAVRDLPSFITQSTDPADPLHSCFTTLRDLFDTLGRETPDKATVIVNSCQDLEVNALAAVEAAYDVLPVGPVLPSAGNEAGIFKQDEAAKYMDWLDYKPADSVVYISFGSLAAMGKEQLDELIRGLEDTGRPYLCVVRKDIKAVLASEVEIDEGVKKGMVVEWCDQVSVLSHAAVGCFVTHCGWNSVLESLTCGVPMVGLGRLSDQRMNAQLVARHWRVGVRAEVDGDGVLRAAELRRCVEEVMGDGEAAAEVRRMAREWKQVIGAAVGGGGSSDRNLMSFVNGTTSA
ncbi:hypothetical protein PR202_ga15047 [Eleusine coracana subsp. coracana]|uniref:Glycosyltransferase n=1 Tax=Eleusine coracana subsp. coracana TaxID=191504 RepID=A0AAV5CJ94_ELECO|nr:hypothetical protein QOZ80_6BG0497400 [Eleusine coracana subsp. coracana]GJM98072.1 hypothetical protein PR202_ga15047 [Eleusine coracana subsp. coracana]